MDPLPIPGEKYINQGLVHVVWVHSRIQISEFAKDVDVVPRVDTRVTRIGADENCIDTPLAKELSLLEVAADLGVCLNCALALFALDLDPAQRILKLLR